MNFIKDELEHLSNDKICEELQFYSLYLLLFERFKNMVVENVKLLLCSFSIEDGKEKYKESREYIKLKNKKYNGKRNIFLSSIEWMKNNNVITQYEQDLVIKCRTDRNNIGHETLDVLFHYNKKGMLNRFIELFKIYDKVDKWWVIEYEMPMADVDYRNVDFDNVMSGDLLMIRTLINNLYGDKN